MRWSNVWVIFRREVRDQVRDRRTLFMILVLPILLYPTLGLGLAQLSVAFEQKARTVVVVGAEGLPSSPPLLNPARDRFDPGLFVQSEEAGRLHVEAQPANAPWSDPATRREALRGRYADAVVLVPPGLRESLERDKTAEFEVAYDTSDERGGQTYSRVREVLETWGATIVRGRLDRDKKPLGYTRPVRVRIEGIAQAAAKGKEPPGPSVWARLFPFLLVMMSLTGAFYPAIDLCAGEKERGTMETLLISPASRPEIVAGKFLTVLLASMATAFLNLLSMGLTGLQLSRQLSGLSRAGAHAVAGGPVIQAPSLEAAFWMVVLLVPLATFFSAVSLALAVLARSMKEGQYYMTPLYLVAMPLVFLTLMPGVELDLFTSLVPVTGASLLLRTLMQGDYSAARLFFLPVLLPILAYTWIALRWAVAQFQREDILFREAERFDLLAWVRHLLTRKPPTPAPTGALLCFTLMLTTAWFLFPALTVTGPWGMAVGQMTFILGPPLVLALLFTSRPGLTLRLALPRTRYLVLALGLALAINPLVAELRVWVEHIFPVPEQVKRLLEEMVAKIPDLWTGLLLLALIPAVCEEVAFRGYILSALERGHPTRSAILLSAILFGFMHVLISLFAQLFNATLLGIVLGWLAVRSRSLLPGIVFHFLNNGLAVAIGVLIGDPRRGPLVSALVRSPSQGLYHYPWVALGAVASAVLLAVLIRDRGPADLTKPRVPPDPFTVTS